MKNKGAPDQGLENPAGTGLTGSLRRRTILPDFTVWSGHCLILIFFARKCTARSTQRTILLLYHPVFLFRDDRHFRFKSIFKGNLFIVDLMTVFSGK